MSRREYSEETKAAVMAALLAGQSIRQVAKETGVPKSTVAAWGKEMGDIASTVQSVPDTKKERVGELLVDLLIARIESQIAMARHAGDTGWLKDQDASAVAMLMGVTDDKLVRMLEMFGQGEESP